MVFGKSLSQDESVATQKFGFHGNNDAPPKSRHEETLLFIWVDLSESLRSVSYVNLDI